MTPADGQPTLQQQEQYWDDRWSRTPRPNDWQSRRGEVVLQLLRELPVTSPKILDMGCGTGWFTARLAELGSVIGVDLSETAIDIARGAFPNVTYSAGNLLTLPLPEKHFDVVVSQEVIAHVEDQVGYMRRAAEVLRPRGFLIITTVNKFVHERLDWPVPQKWHIESWLTRREFLRLLDRDFEILKTTSTLIMGDRGLLRWLNSPKLGSALRLALISPQAWERWKERMGLGWTRIAVARKRS
jgi:2-polyprenyl-3-methyl-5-hydroxy-6-metoxy-1,4-benzoquinol methylase